MQVVQETKSALSTGLRERKRAETHARIQAEAMRLFLRDGFEATTLDDIARAADVSRRSLFHYFASKEEIVLSTKVDLAEVLVEAIQRRPSDEPMLDMVENAMTDLAVRFRSSEAKDVYRLIHTTPSLSAGDQAKFERVERALAKALADHKGLPEADLNCRVTASAAIGIMKLSTEAWLAGDESGPEVFGQAAFAALRGVAR